MSDDEVTVKRLNVRQVMAELNISRPTFYRWIAQGKLRARRINGSLRVSADDIRRVDREYPKT